jgi:hypothetical protein
VNSVPFRMRYLLGNLARVEGVARLDHDELVLEFSIVDGFFGILRSRPKEVRVGLADLESVEFRRGWFGEKLRIVTRRVRALEAIPGAKGPELKLRCRRRHRVAAEELASSLRLQATEKHLKALRGAAQQADEADEAPLELKRGVIVGRTSERSSS